MRTLRLSLLGTIILTLLASSSVAVVAQAEETTEGTTEDATVEATEAAAPVVVSGTLECLGELPEGEGGEDAATPQDEVVNLHRWEATDPRLSGEVTYTGRWQLYEEPPEDAGIGGATDAAIYEIVNEGGHWLCEASRTPAQRTPTDAHTLVFDGEGEYEGLTAYLHVDWSQVPYTFTGLILRGEAPPFAEPQG